MTKFLITLVGSFLLTDSRCYLARVGVSIWHHHYLTLTSHQCYHPNKSLCLHCLLNPQTSSEEGVILISRCIESGAANTQHKHLASVPSHLWLHIHLGLGFLAPCIVHTHFLTRQHHLSSFMLSGFTITAHHWVPWYIKKVRGSVKMKASLPWLQEDIKTITFEHISAENPVVRQHIFKWGTLKSDCPPHTS